MIRNRKRALSTAGLVVFALIAMAQAPSCPSTDATATATPKAAPATSPKAAATTVAASPAAASPKAPATQAATAAAEAGGAASVGWDHPPLEQAQGFTLAAPYRSVGVFCDRGLPPGAKATLRLSGSAGPPATAEGTVAADGTVRVLFGIQSANEIVAEYASIVPTSGAAPTPLPAGSRGTVTLPADKVC